MRRWRVRDPDGSQTRASSILENILNGEPAHECPDNEHLGCGECGGDPVCECEPGECPEEVAS
jgi:hypothetical protein